LAHRRRGFTLIELLVVIAIIGILAAMLFPVFARAREAARKTQCLANVKNIAMGIQIYLTDYDRFPPSEHREEVLQWFDDMGAGRDCSTRVSWMNPYLRFPVIFDDYIKSREVWHCPSAISTNHTGINPCTKDWLAVAKDNEDLFYCTPECNAVFPNGWGGTVTDSYYARQGCGGLSTGAIAMSIGVPRTVRDISTSQISDSAKRVVVGEVGMDIEYRNTSAMAYPDMWWIEDAACEYPRGDWENCAQSRTCGAGDPRLQIDPNFRKAHAPARHMGGDNVGFADGHAKWFSAEAIMFGGEPGDYITDGDLLEGVRSCGFGPPNDAAQEFLQTHQ
jgi:prepilin-type N-terminal cleavage/methylation domain-containing protein/prepilin-type processing-associated H-X9-DG protein